jgi:hypothetical protein
MFMAPPHMHPNDEYLMFFSSDPHDMKIFGAVVEVAYGSEWEKVVFSHSALVHFPKNRPHCPIHVKRMDRPFLFGHFWLMGETSNFVPAPQSLGHPPRPLLLKNDADEVDVHHACLLFQSLFVLLYEAVHDSGFRER